MVAVGVRRSRDALEPTVWMPGRAPEWVERRCEMDPFWRWPNETVRVGVFGWPVEGPMLSGLADADGLGCSSDEESDVRGWVLAGDAPL